ncbi:TIGR03894 family protein [uncultured Prochlorococcus sp.]|uniref:TIGR03894 family protein n=1 Tax=Prochlorococcus sp. TaxID=1220 RepID=UPI000025B176|nr:TIGR03894 family protein [uncultured Prochlorococcus sp.]MAK08736.1 TIGR03894 family protein [Prochlorococcus sp. MED105]MDC3073108.1 TIGR03894 family protein [Prochlorococcus sp. AH-716-O10]MDC3234000.1 TIGR03894 family protein [Prochlorococcus sp. AH-716-A06]RCL48662.1 MAG: TIGR03894 family protein [Prochlorococcus sp. MED-G72]
MSVDRELLKEVTQELWNTVKKLRPEIDRETRLQLVLKALLTIGDLPDQLQAAMVVGVCAEMDKSDIENADGNSNTKEESNSTSVDTSTGRKVFRRSSAK